MILYASKSGKHVAIEVDDDDFYTVVKYNWYICSKGYVVTNVRKGNKKRILYMHRLLTKAEGFNNVVDHINFDRSDNRRSNLRIIDRAANVRHRPHMMPNKDNFSSGYRGVSWNLQGQNWLARVQYKGVTHCKCFQNKEDAGAWAENKRQEFGFSSGIEQAFS